jgi:hypothetical protein
MIRKLGLVLSAAVVATLAASGAAHAFPALPNLQNLNFLDYTGSAPKNSFTSVNPVGWTGGNGLIYIDAPGTATSHSGGIATHVDPGALNIPGGYNYVEADGNPDYESGFNYEVTGLTAGQTYTLSFYQAAGQQTEFSGATTNQWIVALGSGGINVTVDGAGFGHYSNSDPGGSIAATTLMNVPSDGGVPWEFVSVNLTADASTDFLSFLAWGDNGSTANLPPMAFLTGVNSPAGLNPGVPEPAVWGLMILGFAGAGASLRAQRAKRPAAAQA